MNRGSCGCSTPRGVRPGQMRERTLGQMRESSRKVREQSAPQRPRETDPVVVRGSSKRAQCRPFLKVEKDAALFAACNALADELGPINTPKKAFELISEAIGDEVNEVFGIVTLDLHLRFKGLAETGRGEPDSVMAPIKPTAQVAIADGAHVAILFHCHPSGVEAEPSEADRETTDAFVEAFDVIDIPIMDHIIVGGSNSKKSYYSFAEAGDI